MNVMNIKHYLSVAAALVMFAACSDYDAGMSENVEDYTVEELAVIKEYEANFIERYGEIDPNHTWGFGAKGSEDEMGTRAVQVERNNWAIAIKKDNTVVSVTTAVGTDVQNPNGSHYYEYTTKQGYTIPGFPSTVDGKYYIEENNQQVGYTEDEIKSKMQYNQVQPVGDVTDEEIEYVSWWFRTHPNITSETPPFTEYFVQDISQDFDRSSYPNGNWIDATSHDPSTAQRLVPVKLYENGQYLRDENPEGINYGMDYFSVKTHESDGSDFWEHNNNLNKQKANPIAEYAPATATDTMALVYSTTHYSNRTLKYWTSEGPSQNINGQTVYKDGKGYTTSFSFHNSNDNHDYQNYVLVHLTFKGPRTGKVYDGWYLGFDYELHKQTDIGNNQIKKTDVERDYYYSNWIVKLAPGNPQLSDHQWYRIMCEDLGNTYDYDFNDLVYDVYFTGTAPNYVAHIKVQAVGGTLPIYINGQELHQLLGASARPNGLYNPINVGGEKRDPQYMVLTMSTTDPDDIEIGVPASGKNRKNNDFILPKSHGGTTVSKAPQKICIPGNTTKWMKESMQIESSYLNFDKWVNEQNGMYGFDHSSAWNTWSSGIDAENLYNP